MRNEAYIFRRGSTSITWDKVSGQTGGYGWLLAEARKRALSRRFVAWVVCLLMGMGGLERERDVYRNGK